jgi:hypothetical protein
MRSADLRARLGHPVVDADGHVIETIPVFKTFFLDYVKDIGGGDLAVRFEASGGMDFDDMVLRPWSALTPERRREIWATRPSWWSLPAANTLDRATAHLPRLLHERLDEFGIDSEYDYDPVWRRCLELGVAPASHTPGMGWGSRRSISSYMYNHIGSFGASMEATCKALFLGGVTRRFPKLCFGLLEGGVGWACSLYADLLSHWEKRNREAIHHLDPARIDTALLVELFAKYGDARFRADLAGLAESFTKLEPEPPVLDEFAACGIARAEDVRDLFVPRFYFGCEADDPMVAWAFHAETNPLGAQLRAMFSSDIGHWDVPDMAGILAEAWELVEDGLIGEPDFRDFVFANPVRFYTSANPDFFRGTRCEAAAAVLVAEQAR